MATKHHSVRPDSKGRVTLGKLAMHVDSFTIREQKDGSILLEPQVEIPAREVWLFHNKPALKQVRKGLKDAAAGKVKHRGSFAHYVAD